MNTPLRTRPRFWMACCATAAVLAGATGATAATPEAPKQAAAQPRAPLPLAAFADLPLISQVALSPDGQRYAALMNSGGNTVLVTRALAGGGASKPLLKTDNKEFRVAWIRWVSNERLLVSTAYRTVYAQLPITDTRLFSVRPDGSDLVNLSKASASRHAAMAAQFQDRVIDWMEGDGQHVLLELEDDASRWPSVFKVAVDTGRRTVVHHGRVGITHWVTDAAHRVRVGVGISATGKETTVQVCDPDGSNWREIWRFALKDGEGVQPLGFGRDPNRLFVLDDHQGFRALFEVDLKDPALHKRLVLSEPQTDLRGTLQRDPKTGEVVGFGGRFWDSSFKALKNGIDRALPDRHNEFVQFSADGSRYLLYSGGNAQPGQFLVGDRQRGGLDLLGDTYPALAEAALARKETHEITARDGLKLPVLVTLPLGREPRRLPTVVLPHGGPLSEDTDEFDPWVQFLADRGYAVLQVNFRGSTGSGRSHLLAGLRRWGLEMQDDITDALQWMVKRGTADPARVCIVGGSYGGYAALIGVVKTPDAYRCAVSFAGISDLLELELYERKFRDQEAAFEETIGGAWKDRGRLADTSPIKQVASIHAPVLLVHGTMDGVVPYRQSADMAAAMERAGKRVRLVTQEGGDHHLSQQAFRTEFFKELDAFLAQHLQP